MRKFLSLVLALVMVMSLTTLTAGAKEFTDADSITYDEAVNVISSLGVVDGYAGGAFGPSGQLTRQAAAKIICNLILGPTTARALSADVAPFPDVPTGGEFAGYIAYCAKQGIIGGYPDGTFRPGAPLTGYAFMKMLLGGLGYDASIEGFGGPNWTINVGKLAIGIGLDDGLTEGFDGSKAVTREEAALYAMNTLEATMVTYGQKITIMGPDGKPQTIGYTKATNEAQGQYKSYDTPAADDDGNGNRTLQFCEKYFEDLKKTATSDDFERPSHTWKIKTNEVGTYVNNDDLVTSWTTKVTKDALYNALGKPVVDDLKDGDGDLKFYVDGDGKGDSGVDNGTVSAANVGNFAARKDTAKINSDASDTGDGALTEVYLDKDTGDVTIVTINTYVFQATSDYSESKDEVKIAEAGDTGDFIRLDSYTLDGEDFNISDVKEDDYLLITAYKDGASYKVKSVAAAETITGEVTAYAKESKVTVDGTEYGYSLKTNKDGGVKSLVQSTGGQVSLIMDAYGHIIAVDDTVTGGNYVFISAAESTLSFTKVIAHAYFSDGTVEDINLKKVDNSTNKDDLRAARGWYTYSKDSNDSYTLNPVKGSYKAAHDLALGTTGKILSNGKAGLTNIAGASGIRANERTIFVIEDTDGDVYTYTGVSNAPDINVTTGPSKVGYVWNNKTGYASYVFVSVDDAVNADVDTSTESDQYVFLLELDSTRNNGTDTYYRYKAIVDGERTTIDTDDEYTVNKLYTKVKVDSNTDRVSGMRELANDATDSKYHYEGSLTDVKVTFKNGVLSIGSESFIINSDSELNLIVDDAAADLLVDKGAKYETYTKASGANFASVLNSYSVSGYYYVVTNDNYSGPENNRNVKVLYMYVSGDQASGTVDVPAAKTAIQNMTKEIAAADTELTEMQARNAVSDAIEAAVSNRDVKISITWGAFTGAENGTSKDDISGTDGSLVVTKIKLTSGSESTEITSSDFPITWTLKAKAYALSNAEKVDAAKTALVDQSNIASPDEQDGTKTAFADMDAAKAAAEDALEALLASTGAELDVAASEAAGGERGFKWDAKTGATDWANGTIGNATAEAGTEGTYPVTVYVKAGTGSDAATGTKVVNVTLKPAAFKDTADGVAAKAVLDQAVTDMGTSINVNKSAGGTAFSTYADVKTAVEGAIATNVDNATNIKVETAANATDPGSFDNSAGEATGHVDVTLTYKTTTAESASIKTTVTIDVVIESNI